ncbi:LysR substrate-binding domain-containing protein [Actinomadura viridis]|uniref:DNA-binding transcriptional LysR family regulator n=1 Tax=Actinomadura viridis TaxID=58110 RepID=A0A931GMM8_9ACTN|nr:LysR family transcriptional regulator [Actinomadura viridis]MBG6088656.1 DNA-binding transcriptional LysR family regulator [Actinomadura viridis]
MFDLHRLRLLSELKRRGTITAVAGALNYSPSTISQQLARLEAEAGVPLLEPVGRRVRLTPQAEILVSHADIVLRQLEAAESEIARSLTRLSGTVRVAAFQTVLLALLPPVLAALRAAHPGLRVELIQAEPHVALPRLLAHDVDLVVAEEYPGHPLPRPPEITYQEVCRDIMRIALPPEDRGAGPADVWERAAGRPWIAEPHGAASRRWVRELCRHAGFEPDIRYATDDLLVHRRLVADGHAVAILPDLLWFDRHRPRPVLVGIPGGPHARRIVTACRRDHAEHPAIRACRTALGDAAMTTQNPAPEERGRASR